jgi:para-aminobenzoate synthetase/4-amino-4-deoxychorismate lyase
MKGSETVVRLDSFSCGNFASSWRFAGHVATLEAFTASELPALLDKVEQATMEGLFAVGYVAYEAGSALNPDLPALPGVEGLPLAWFALYRERHTAADPAEPTGGANEPPILVPALSLEEYSASLEQISSLIAAGESYQINYTFPLTGDFAGEPLQLYRRIAQAQQAPFCAYLDTGRFVIMSASPELFFSRNGRSITTRPMKGTSPRGRWPAEDLSMAKALAASDKERAENLMIVDLLRNDLGIAAETGSVTVESLFQVESYPTVHQMTSTVSASLKEGTGLVDVFGALFPCGSVTGAPKKRSMEIIADLEKTPRGVYCGAIGCLAPGGDAIFSVAIRTLLLDRSSSRLTLNVGSGVTWSSNPGDEYRECLGKAAFAAADNRPFVLIETMRMENRAIPRLRKHIGRMAASARYFDFPFAAEKVLKALGHTCTLGSQTLRVRLTLDAKGEFVVTTTELENGSEPLRLAFAGARVDSGDRFRYHKTSHRDLLDSELRQRNDCDELLFINERGELTEGSYNNLLLKVEGRLVTPTLASGLLPGVLRAELLECGRIVEETLYPCDLAAAEEIWLMNSLRGLRRAVLAEGELS